MPSSDKFEEMLTAHLNDMYALAFQLTGSHHNAEDLVQDLFINLSMRQYRTREIERPKAWLATILYRTFVDQWRRQKRSPLIYGADDEHAAYSTASDRTADREPEVEYERGQKRELAMEILRRLNLRQREIVILHDLHEYTMNEIAVIMNLPLGTVKSNLHRARTYIAAYLENRKPDDEMSPGAKSNARPATYSQHSQASLSEHDALQESVS